MSDVRPTSVKLLQPATAAAASLVFTRFFPDSMPEIEVAEQKAVVAVELQTVRALCEGGHAGRAAA